MNCGCTKHLGCYTTGSDIEFGIIAPYDGNYTFQITTSAGYYEEVVWFNSGDPIILPFNFNENSVTHIKIKAPTVSGFSVPYLTSADGACCFEISGIVPIC